MLPDKAKMIFALIGLNIVMVLLLVIGFRLGMHYSGTGPEQFGFITDRKNVGEVRSLAEKTIAQPQAMNDKEEIAKGKTETVSETTRPAESLVPAEPTQDDLDKETQKLLARMHPQGGEGGTDSESAEAKAEPQREEVAAGAKVADVTKPTEAKAEEETGAKVKPEPKHGRIVGAPQLIGKSFYTVQVRSSYNRKLAEDIVKEFKRQGYFAFLGAREVKGKEWFRINVGKFESREIAEAFKEKFARNHNIPDAIVQHFH